MGWGAVEWGAYMEVHVSRDPAEGPTVDESGGLGRAPLCGMQDARPSWRKR